MPYSSGQPTPRKFHLLLVSSLMDATGVLGDEPRLRARHRHAIPRSGLNVSQ